MTDATGDGGSTLQDRPPPVVVDVDPWSGVVFAAAAIVAAAAWAVVTIAPEQVTRVAVGVLVGVALSPLVTAVQRRGTSRGLAATLVAGGLALLFGAVVLVVGPAAVEQAGECSAEVPETIEELYGWPIVGPRLEEADAAVEVQRWIDELPARIDDRTLAELGERLLGGVLSTVVVLVTAVGVLVDGERIVRRVRAVVPPSRQAAVDGVGRIVYESFGSYFAGSLVVAVLSGLVVLSVGLALGVPLAPVAGLWATLTNLIPQIGGFLGGSFFVLLALTESPLTAVIAGAVFLAYQQFENNVIGPAVVGKAVNLTPPTTMLAALVGGAAAGVPGALVATPLLGAAKALYLDRQGRLDTTDEDDMPTTIRRRFEQLRARLSRWR